MIVRSSVSNFRPLKTYGTVLFDTWSDSERVVDVVGDSNTCKHLSVVGDRCQGCGAFVGWIGTEKRPEDFYRHIYMLSNYVYPDSDFFVYSDRLVPVDFVLEVLGQKVTTKHYRSSWYLEREDKFVNVFSMTYAPKRNLNLWKGFWFDFILSKAVAPVLILNPTEEYQSFPCDWVVANKVFDVVDRIV